MYTTQCAHAFSSAQFGSPPTQRAGWQSSPLTTCDAPPPGAASWRLAADDEQQGQHGASFVNPPAAAAAASARLAALALAESSDLEDTDDELLFSMRGTVGETTASPGLGRGLAALFDASPDEAELPPNLSHIAGWSREERSGHAAAADAGTRAGQAGSHGGKYGACAGSTATLSIQRPGERSRPGHTSESWSESTGHRESSFRQKPLAKAGGGGGASSPTPHAPGSAPGSPSGAVSSRLTATPPPPSQRRTSLVRSVLQAAAERDLKDLDGASSSEDEVAEAATARELAARTSGKSVLTAAGCSPLRNSWSPTPVE